MKYRFSNDALLLEGQPMFKILAKVQELERQGQSVIHFEIGDPDFNTPSNIIESLCVAARSGETHYTSSMGIYDLRKAVQTVTEKSRGFKPHINQVLIAPGANIIIYYAIKCLVNPGDDVIVPDPGFPTYYSVLKFCGVNPIRIPLKEENDFRMNPDDVRKNITPKTRLIIMNSPQNPTGSVMTPDEIKEMAEIAKENDVYLFSDEVYSRMIFDETKFSSPSILDECKKRTIIVNGFSKVFAMTGWRLGVAIAPEDVIEKMSILLQTTSSCVTPFIQRAGIEAILGDQTAVYTMIKEYKERRNLIVSELNKIPKLSCYKSGGAFYVFPNIKNTGMNSEQFAGFMLEKAGVALLPGTNFGIYGEGYVRLCYANSKENIIEGLNRIKNALS